MPDVLESEVAAEFDNFWKPLVTTDGVWDLDQVKRELYDYSQLLHEVPLVYTEVTGNMISKPNTHAFEVINAYRENNSRFTRDGTEAVWELLDKTITDGHSAEPFLGAWTEDQVAAVEAFALLAQTAMDD